MAIDKLPMIDEDESSLINDLSALNQSLKHISALYGQDPELGQLTYTQLKPAIEKVARGSLPDQLDPSVLEAGIIYSNAVAPRLEEYRAAKMKSLEASQSRAGLPFDPTNPVDAKFVDEKGQASFNAGNYRDFLKTRGVPDDIINGFDEQNGSDIGKLMQTMRPNEQVAVMNMMSKITENQARALAEADKPLQLTTKMKNELQGKIATQNDSLNRISYIEENTRPDFLTIGGRGKSWATSNIEKLAPSLVPQEQKQYLAAYTDWNQANEQLFNQYRKEITGAAAAVQELERLQKSFVNGKLSQSEYAGAMKNLKTNMQLIRDTNYSQLESGKITKFSIAEQLEKSGNLVPLFSNTGASKYADQSPDNIIGAIATNLNSGNLTDNDLAEAASVAYEKRTGKSYSKLTDEQKQRVLEITRKAATQWSLPNAN